MIGEHDRIVLTKDHPDYGLEAGDVGTVVHVYPDHEAFEVEFVTLTGETIAVITVERNDVRPVRARELTHARGMK